MKKQDGEILTVSQFMIEYHTSKLVFSICRLAIDRSLDGAPLRFYSKVNDYIKYIPEGDSKRYYWSLINKNNLFVVSSTSENLELGSFLPVVVVRDERHDEVATCSAFVAKNKISGRSALACGFFEYKSIENSYSYQWILKSYLECKQDYFVVEITIDNNNSEENLLKLAKKLEEDSMSTGHWCIINRSNIRCPMTGMQILKAWKVITKQEKYCDNYLTVIPRKRLEGIEKIERQISDCILFSNRGLWGAINSFDYSETISPLYGYEECVNLLKRREDLLNKIAEREELEEREYDEFMRRRAMEEEYKLAAWDYLTEGNYGDYPGYLPEFDD